MKEAGQKAARPDRRRSRRLRFSRDDRELAFLCFPAAVWFIAFCYVPLFGIVFAFKNYKVSASKGFLYSLFVHSKWVGLRNFKFLFRSPDLAVILRNTVGYNLVFLLIGVTLPVALAIMLTQLHSRRLAKICQTAVFLPHFLSWVVISCFVFAFLSTDKGLVNSLIRALGGSGVLWYQDCKFQKNGALSPFETVRFFFLRSLVSGRRGCAPRGIGGREESPSP